MTTPITIPLPVLVRAVSALKAAKDAPSDKLMAYDTWMEVMKSHNELSYAVHKLLAERQAPVS